MSTSRHHVVSVVLGYDANEYQSSSAAMNQHVGDKPAGTPKTASENINKKCHVQFGEPGTKREFITSSKLADPTGEVLKYRGELAKETKDLLMQTSSCYGNDVVPYVSSTQLATQWDKKAVAETIRLRNEIRARTGPRPTRGMSYDDEIEYVSEAKSAYENKFKIHKPSTMAASVKKGMLADLRSTHFSLGHEKLDYKTSSHIERLSPDQFALYATRPPPLHDLKKSTVEIS
ncbi:hypothetical protein JG687_00008713 [Phytophthora cactorum]|uniref:Uncharacterized protein n=1 Tax=Phytophthora cactorum TaxID=29920 RepID=A0A329RWY0_9STRA|nr:hypothetical protein Pcac1_g24837 [Phytophthora cactorum]KAG2820094.1 hypothetical protein PC111_g11607 [Phytophthora cactorum]KAG2820552.1 hypothetical protein PC112_g11725 [Phytophthora cactorum]KAG2910928.1 hypothetical protein PC115_g12740 [Phytophthora cactorum]KAG2917209.1 hypothetical protein PC114_g7216 [Phytophthora cactorum]